ncbi:MAG: class I SAM-dependent methyltransferase [Gaiellales bacterium]|nr:MAG: class I SAM-dependent methyltransferase [Gaiellales bacterium]
MGRNKDDSRWEEMYQAHDVETMPWYLPGLDPDFEEALENHSIGPGKALDLCTGPATQAMALAELGFDVFATDISETAVRLAAQKAKLKGLEISFRQADILRDDLGGEFDLLLDRGCFHVFEPGQRGMYVDAVDQLLRPGGYLLLKCFSHREKRREGPYRFTPEELGGYFSGVLKVLSIRDAVFKGTLEHYPKALFCVMRKPGRQ